MPDSPPLKLFIIYAREDQPALLELKAHLRPLEKRGDLTVWYDGEILPGQDWDRTIKEQLAAADIVLLFISKHFFNSEYIEKEELKKALERHNKGEVVVAPVIVKPCVWDVHLEIGALQVLPKDGKAVSSWTDADEAFTDVVRGVHRTIEDVQANRIKMEQKRLIDENIKLGRKAYNEGKYEEAFNLLSKYCNMGYEVDPSAYTELALLYEKKQTENFSKEEAVKWFRMAADLNEPQGLINLAYKYLTGDGVPENTIEAEKLLRRAAIDESGFGEAAQLLLKSFIK